MTRRRGGETGVQAVLLGVAIVLALAATAPPSESFTTANYDRHEVIDVVQDSQGVLGLEKSATVTRNTNDSLLNLTNRVGRDVTVTVALQDPTQGTLRVDTDGDGTYEQEGGSVTFSLLDGARQRVDLDSGENPNTVIPYDVSSTAPGVSVTAPGRQTETTGGNGGGNCPPGNPNHPKCQ